MLAGMETPSVAMMARSTFWMLWVSMELRRARLLLGATLAYNVATTALEVIM